MNPTRKRRLWLVLAVVAAAALATSLIALALQLQRESGAEAVICIANQRLTESLVQAMERRGIPAYGAIWDS